VTTGKIDRFDTTLDSSGETRRIDPDSEFASIAQAISDRYPSLLASRFSSDCL